MSVRTVFGIDLGTTYSCISRVDEHGKPEVIPNAEGQLTTPSIVYFESSDNVVVGEAAREEAAFHPDLVVSAVKRSIGKAGIEFSFHDNTYRPQEVSAYILKKLARDAEQIVGESVEDVVITCPAYFGIEQKEATKQAGEIAGLNVLYVIPEPTAAAIAYGMDQQEQEVILVYDLGGGTFDVTLIEVNNEAVNVISTGGDDELGGKDWDGKVIEFFADEFERQTGIPAEQLLEDPETLQMLMTDAESAKIALGRKEKVVKAIRHAAERANVELTREKFDDLTKGELDRTYRFTEQMIEKAKEKGIEKIDKILLVGGSSYMPQVEKRLADFGIELQLYDPNLIVAKGAAIFGYKCQLEQMIKIAIADATGQDVEEIKIEEAQEEIVEKARLRVAEDQGLRDADVQRLVDKKIVNVTSKSFGIVIMDSQVDAERVANLIQKDDQVPREKRETFGTYTDNQTGVDLRLMENQIISDGDTIELKLCTEVGNARLTFQRPLPKDSQIEVTFKLGPDGRLHMEALDTTTGEQIEANFETESIMSQEEIQEAKQQALKMLVS